MLNIQSIHWLSVFLSCRIEHVVQIYFSIEKYSNSTLLTYYNCNATSAVSCLHVCDTILKLIT